MSLGKASIKRASAASKKKTAVEKTAEAAVEVKMEENEAVPVEFISEDIKKEERKDRPVRVTEEMPTFLL